MSERKPPDSDSTARKAVKGALGLGWTATKATGRLGVAVGKPVAKQTGKLAAKGGRVATDYAIGKVHIAAVRRARYTEVNFYEKAAIALEDAVDALMRQNRGASARAVRALAKGAGGASATAGMFGLASLVGTASTGTPIATLSGAAFNSAALAWIGGSVVTGTWIVAAVGLLGTAAAGLAVRRVTGSRRRETHLGSAELRVRQVCLSLAGAFRQQQLRGAVLDEASAHALAGALGTEFRSAFALCLAGTEDWPAKARRRLEMSNMALRDLAMFLGTRQQRFGASGEANRLMPPVAAGVLSATFLKLMADRLPNFDENERLVLDALRRSNGALAGATDRELADYVQGMNPAQLAGLKNNVKGIYHELAFQARENTDGDAYVVELSGNTNHPGADVVLINMETGQTTEIQLKATRYADYVREHNNRYDSVEILTTEEVAASLPDVEGSGFSNEALDSDTRRMMDELGGGASVVDSMALAAMINLATNTRALLSRGQMTPRQKEKMIENGVVAAGTAGLVQLLL